MQPENEPKKKKKYERRYMKIDEAAEYLSVHKTTIYSWIENGWLKKYKLGSTMSSAARLDRDEIDEFIKNSEEKLR